MNAPVGIGLIGAGMIGQGHAYALRLLTEDGETRPVAVTDFSADAVESARRICPFERVAPDAQAVIDDPDVDAVVIVTPTTTHRDLVAAVVAAGKPLLCEKPLATQFSVVQEMCTLVERSGLTAQVGFHSRFHPLIHELVRLVTTGELGAPMGYTLRDDQYWPTGDIVPGHSSWRSQRAQAGGGALLEHSIHSADILTWLFGPAASVYARTRNVFAYDVEDTAVCTIEHSSGVVGTLISIFNGVRGREERRLEVFFERGAVEVTTDFLVGAREDGFLVQRPDQEPERLDVGALRDRHFDAEGINRRDFFVYLYPAARAFVRSVRAEEAASPAFSDALAAHALVDAAYRSVSGNAAVAVELPR
ncbi:MAG TPA: Gfo/Idh/MocA family oxidoreductase [Acidimicrobiia bacterium]|nr:Gfo/Idh/MocA family oxidoreductase [Acidimicrobiia bacterium]